MIKLTQLSCVDLDAGAHGGCYGAALDILTLSSGRLSLDDSTEKCVEVLSELFSTEGSLTDGAVDDVGLVETILDTTSLGFLNLAR